MGDALKDTNSKIENRLDRIGKLGLFWNQGYDSFVNGDFNIGMTEVKTFSDEAFDNLLAKIKLEMERRGVLPVNEPKVIPLNKKVETTTVAAPEKKVSIFGAAKVKPATKSAKDDKIVVEIPGLEEKLLKLQTLKGEIADGEAQLAAITDEVKSLAKEKFLELYKANKTNPNTFLIKDGSGCIQVLPMDKYIMVKDEERANQLIDEYGKEVVTVDEKYYFNPEVLERNQDVIEELIANSTAISDADKENMLKKEVKYSIAKGMIDELYHFGNKMENAIADIQPIFMLKNCGGKAEEGGVINSGDLIDDVPVKLGYSDCCFAPVYGEAEVCSHCGQKCNVLSEEEVQNEIAEASYAEGGSVDRTSWLAELKNNVAHMRLKRLYKELEKAQFDGNVKKIEDIVEKIQAIELAEGSEELEQLHEARGYGRGGSVDEKEFIKKIKSESGHILDKIKTSKGDTMIYYREYGSSPSDVKTKVFADGGETESWSAEMKGKYPVATDSYDVPNISDRWGYAGGGEVSMTSKQFYSEDGQKLTQLIHDHDSLLNRQGYYSKGVAKLAHRIQLLKEKMGLIADKKESGGNVAAGKVWEVSMIMNPIVPSELKNPKHLVRIFHLGSASDKFDVEQQIAREGLNVREILSITEIANSNEWEDFTYMKKTGKGIAVKSKADALKTYPNLLKNNLVSFGGGKNGYNIAITDKGENPYYAAGGVAIAQKEFEISDGENVYWGTYHYEGNRLFMDSCETMDAKGNLVDIYEKGIPDKLHDISTQDKVYALLEDETKDEVRGRFDYDYATGGEVGTKYKLGDFVFARLYKDQSIKTPFIVSHWSHDAYYILGDGSHYVKEDKLEPATAKDFDDYYGEGKAKEYVRALNSDEFGKPYEMGGNAAPGEWVVYNDETDTLIGKPHSNRTAAKRAMNDLFKTGKYSAIGMETKAEWDSTHKLENGGEVEITYKGKTITKLLSGMYEFYSDKQERFVKCDTLSRAKEIIAEESKKPFATGGEVNVHGVSMSRVDQMKFDKYISNNNIALNTKTKEERQELVSDWLAGQKGSGGVSNRKWMEIKNDFTDDEGVTHIDAFLTEDDNEEGKVIATIDKEGNVTYIDGDAKTDPYAQEMIKEITDQTFADGGKLENRTELVFTAKTKEDADRLEGFLSGSDTYWFADRDGLNFNFPVSESDVDMTEHRVQEEILNKYDIHGHWESFETGGKVANKKAKTIEDVTELMPEVVAEIVAEGALKEKHEWYERKMAETDNKGKRIFPNLKNPITAENLHSEIEWWADYLVKRAEHLFQVNDRFKKSISAKDELGRDNLYMWMQHWMGIQDSRVFSNSKSEKDIDKSTYANKKDAQRWLDSLGDQPRK